MTQLTGIMTFEPPVHVPQQTGANAASSDETGLDFESELAASMESASEATEGGHDEVVETDEVVEAADAQVAGEEAEVEEDFESEQATIKPEIIADTGTVLSTALPQDAVAAEPAEDAVVVAPVEVDGSVQVNEEPGESDETGELQETPEPVELEAEEDASEHVILPAPTPAVEVKAATPSIEAVVEEALPVTQTQSGTEGSASDKDAKDGSSAGEKPAGLAQGAASGATTVDIEENSFSALFDDETAMKEAFTTQTNDAKTPVANDAGVALEADVKPVQTDARVDATAIKAQTDVRPVEAKAATPAGAREAAFVNDVGEKVVAVFRTNLGKAVIHLDPPELGHLKVDVTVKDGVLKASISADTMAVKEMLDAGTAGLKSALSRHGLNVDEINIFFDNSGNRQQLFGEGAGNGRNKAWDERFGSGARAGMDAQEVIMRVPEVDGAVDIFI